MNQPMVYQPLPNQKPGMITAIAIMTLINGILNILWSIGLACAFISTLVGIICVPFAAYPIVLGILEIIYAAKLISNPPKPIQPAKWLAIMEICDVILGNIISLVVGIIALVFYNDPAVQSYFADLNAQSQTPASN
jgi:hypothetical protein